GVVTSPTETLRAQTPRSSKRTPGVNQASVLSGTPGVDRSAIISNGDLPATSAQMEQLMEPLYDVDPYMECKENREVILETKDVADVAPLMEVKAMEVKPRAVIRTPVMPKLLDSGARSSAKSSGKKKSATPRAMRRGVPLTTPVTASAKRTGTYSVSTVSSAAKSAPKVALVRVDKEVVKKAEVKCHKCNFISKKPSSARCSRDVLEGLPSSSRSIKKKERVNVAEHFARQHARIFEQMETLEDRQHRLSRTKCDSRMRAGKRVISSTIPTERSTINLLATPKGVTPPIHRERVTYTPHRGAVGTFIDTTKLSDRDFELAVANGLIKARSTR
ncbi:unnamed protein product, partial [Nippostrongylus brasiliensis]|uniref:TPX2_importin domain-containing protein n=1 Tax=Nippostrongylus brasiliensis TaxID=27835 RepID=A0A0N4YZG5_NIPBR